MAKSRKETLPILLDLHYKFSSNHFEEFYGESVSYASIEQESYIDLKEMAFEKIGRGIKFRKFGRQGNVLTVKMDITPSEYELFLKIFREEEIDDEATENADGEIKYKKFNFLHDFEISNIRDLTREEKIKFKKAVEPIEDDNDDSDDSDDDNDDSDDIEIEDLDDMEDVDDMDDIDDED
jgi:hypothetical protein